MKFYATSASGASAVEFAQDWETLGIAGSVPEIQGSGDGALVVAEAVGPGAGFHGVVPDHGGVVDERRAVGPLQQTRAGSRSPCLAGHLVRVDDAHHDRGFVCKGGKLSYYFAT